MKRDSELLSGEAQIVEDTTQSMLPHAATKKASLKLGHLGVEAVYPLTPMQRDLYLTSVLKPDTLDVCIGYAISMANPFQIEVWNAVLLAFQERQPMLRTRIYEGSDQRQDQGSLQSSGYGDDVACQCVSTQTSVNLEVVDLTNTACTDDRLATLVRDFIYAPYDIHSSELVRYRIWRLDDDRTVFAMGCHHILMDGVSLASHLRRVAADYNHALVSDITSIIPPSSHSAYLELAEQYCNEFDTPDIRKFWSENLQDVEPISLKVVKKTQVGESVGSTGKDCVETRLERSAIKESHFFDVKRINLIKKYCRQHVMTPAMFFRSVYALLLNKYGNPTQSFIIHSAHSFRPKGHEFSLGLYVNQIPFVFNPQILNGTVDEVFSESRRFQKSMRGYEKLSVGERKQLAPSEDVEFIYNFIDFVPTISLNDSAIEVSRYTNHPRKQVQLVVQIESDGLSLNLYHHSDEFDSCRFLERMESVIEQLVNGEKDLPALRFILTDEEAKLEKWNSTGSEYPRMSLSMNSFRNRFF